jgi:hypothetical protein
VRFREEEASIIKINPNSPRIVLKDAIVCKIKGILKNKNGFKISKV